MSRLAILALLMPLAVACERVGGLAPVTTGTAQPSAGGAVIVNRGDSVYALSRRYNVPVRDLIEANSLQPPYTIEIGQRLVVPASRQYVVQKGDTLTGISRMFGVDVTELSRLNAIQPPYAVQAGQPLRLPGASGTAVAGPVPASAPRGSIQSAELPPPSGGTASRPSVSAAPITETPSAQPPATASSPEPVYNPGREPKLLQPPGAKPAVPAPATPATPPPAGVPEPQQQATAAPPPSPPRTVGEPPPRSGARFLWPVKGKVISSFGPKPDGMHNDGLNIQVAKGTSVAAADNGVVAYAGNELRGFGNLLLVRHSDGWITAYAHLDQMRVNRGDTVKRGQIIGTVGQTGSVTSPQLHFELRKGSQVVDPSDHLEGSKTTEAPRRDGLPGPG